ncbi:PepSY domain-containing protein [Massilia sp. CCM 8733]|uniref:PepSY domain-containing protein n=1 Tax=Massilia mucilaginosa TaxID=2609282 RepID=A0ABX0NTL8_9BURK|nr:PepSY-associated TM helix domain-containing protein [Massilia mucilaginosa]NHZ89922.1 PepSY domain-containing protein [Massilia mucilaginosa]
MTAHAGTPLPPRLRHAMDYLHTWAGVLCCAPLFLVFFMGTLSVFDQELDRWMMPATRVAQPAAVSFDRLARPHLEQLAPGARQWTVQYPTRRAPAMRLSWFENGALQSRDVDATSGRLLPPSGSKGGSGFFFPFHYTFHLTWMDLGYWLLALLSIAMLALLVSGVIIHKKIFSDFFAFRPAKSRQRATLDLHHVSAVLLLPFHFTITLTGLIIMVFVYTKPGIALVYGQQADQATREAFALVRREPSGRRAELASVDAMAAQAKQLWGGGEIRRVSVRNPHDAHASVDFQRRPHDQISYDTRMLTFDGASGALLGRSELSSTLALQRFFTGVHMLPFDHWPLRWLYFAMGLASCVMIGTGMLLWVEKRRLRQAKEGRISCLVVNAVAAAGSVGVLLATLAMLVSNKILPEAIAGRALLEQSTFFLVWIGTLVHALARAWQPRSRGDLGTAWREQAWTSALLALLAVALNGVLTGDHLLRTVSHGNMAVAGTDLVLLASAALAALTARRLRSRGTVKAGAGPLLKEAAL